MSVVAHDDMHLFESIQRGLRAERQRMGQPAPRLRPPPSSSDGTRDVNGTNELLMRNQFRAWAQS